MGSAPLLQLGQINSSSTKKTAHGTYFIQTWGCQMNEEDSEQMALYLEGLGLQPATSIRDAHVVLLNTCSVRRKPEDKAFSLLGQLKAIKESRPDMVIGVCGCMAQVRASQIRERNQHVNFVVGTGQISAIPGLVEEALQGQSFQRRLELPPRKGAIVTDIPQRQLERAGKLKAFVPIQYGCDKFCSFCIVPTTRGRERSRPTDHIVAEVRRLAELGTREVTLLGQTVNSYGKNLAEGNVPFSKLLQLLAGIPGIERIRYTSPYPRDFRTDLISVIRDVPAVMEHCHMPLQGGHNDLLKRMRRLYTVESFTAIVDELRGAMPDIGLTTDVIVGFPGETDEEFAGTMNMMEKIQFDGAYMFKYSPRPGTPAADMEQVPQAVSESRLQQLIELQNQISIDRNEIQLGKTFEVLVERRSPKDGRLWQGYSRCFRMMHFDGPDDLAGKIVNVQAEEAYQWGIKGKIVR